MTAIRGFREAPVERMKAQVERDIQGHGCEQAGRPRALRNRASTSGTARPRARAGHLEVDPVGNEPNEFTRRRIREITPEAAGSMPAECKAAALRLQSISSLISCQLWRTRVASWSAPASPWRDENLLPGAISVVQTLVGSALVAQPSRSTPSFVRYRSVIPLT